MSALHLPFSSVNSFYTDYTVDQESEDIAITSGGVWLGLRRSAVQAGMGSCNKSAQVQQAVGCGPRWGTVGLFGLMTNLPHFA
jgi:hypothetical protein